MIHAELNIAFEVIDLLAHLVDVGLLEALRPGICALPDVLQVFRKFGVSLFKRALVDGHIALFQSEHTSKMGACHLHFALLLRRSGVKAWSDQDSKGTLRVRRWCCHDTSRPQHNGGRQQEGEYRFGHGTLRWFESAFLGQLTCQTDVPNFLRAGPQKFFEAGSNKKMCMHPS